MGRLAPDEVDFFVARLGLRVDDEPMAVIEEWSTDFERRKEQRRDGDCDRLLAAAKGWPLPPAQAGVVAFAQGWLHARRRHSRRALRSFERALGAFEDAGIEEVRPTVLQAMAAEFEVLGDLDRAGALLAEAEGLTGESGVADAHLELDAVTHRLAREDLNRDELLELERRVRAAIGQFRGSVDKTNEARAALALGYVLERQNRAGDAQREMVAASRLALEADDALTHFQAVGALGTLAMGAGELDNAQSLLEVALAGLLDVRDLSSIGRTHASLGAVAELKEEPELAAHHRSEALAAYESLEDQASAQRMRSLLGPQE